MHSLAALLDQTWFIALMGIILIGAVLSAVHYAEVIAHKTGEPYGTLVLSISVTIIEVSLIIAMMLDGHEGSEFIARDAVFATVMIVMNGVIGLCIFMGGFKHYEYTFGHININ
jgi:Ca2+:H+ antiporter